MNRFILTEDERKIISNLHKKQISEENTPTTIQPGVYHDKVLELQNLLKTTYGSTIAADGKLGPKTLGSLEKALKGEPQVKTDQPQVKTDQPQVKTDQPQVKTDQPQGSTGTIQPLNLNNKFELPKAEDLMTNPFKSTSIEDKYSLLSGDPNFNKPQGEEA